MTDEYAIVYDGDPYMDGSHERRSIGWFRTLDDALAAYEGVLARSAHAPKPGLRIERRSVGPWTVVEGGDDD